MEKRPLPNPGRGRRLLPARAGNAARPSVALADTRPPVVYCHPYEFNATELAEYRGAASAGLLFSQGLGRDSFVRRVRHLLTSLPFGRFDTVLSAWGLT